MYGSAAPIDDDDDEEDGYGALRVTAPKRRKGTSAPAVPSQSAFPDLAIPPPPAAPSGGSGGNQRKRRSTGREYIPAYRSGPYAIILALYRDQQVSVRPKKFFVFCNATLTSFYSKDPYTKYFSNLPTPNKHKTCMKQMKKTSPPKNVLPTYLLYFLWAVKETNTFSGLNLLVV